ncbi:MAG: hypothetical protein Q7V10_01450 [Methanobacteriaceae archaeon]|jgi:hypothetical protein|nr:hypothetical protein [Methanobacteriaceae archaeon]MDO9628136.1 hypothetical protein [Methanobacteriaceae archaeon]
MKKDDKKLENSDETELESSFWRHNNTVSFITILMILIPLILIIINVLVYFSVIKNEYNPGFNLANSIALFTASIAISGTFYSNYRNDIRSINQIRSANERLTVQLYDQKNQMMQQSSVQYKNSIEQLRKQFKHNEQQSKKQLEHSEKQLEKQLIFDRERDVMLEIYELLYRNSGSIYYDYDRIQSSDAYILDFRMNIFYGLEKIQDDIKKFYFIPENIRTVISEFIKYINSINEFEANIKPEILFYEKSDIYLRKIYELTEKYTKIEINRN